MPLLDPMEKAALRVVARHVGWVRALWYGLAIRRRVKHGEPFAHLPPPDSEKEAQSRAQAGPAIVLYRRLRRSLGPEDAVDITTDAVEAGALVFLQETVGPLNRAMLAAMSADEREAFVKARGARFPNAEIIWERVDLQQVRFSVLDCRFVSLCAEVGHPELAPIFCKGDARFFGNVEPEVELIRSQTLAAGGTHCPFVIRWKDSADEADADDARLAAAVASAPLSDEPAAG